MKIGWIFQHLHKMVLRAIMVMLPVIEFISHCLSFFFLFLNFTVKRQRRSYFCGHCSKELTKTLYFQHKKAFYNKKEKQWSHSRVCPDEQSQWNDFEFNIQGRYLAMYSTVAAIKLKLTQYVYRKLK